MALVCQDISWGHTSTTDQTTNPKVPFVCPTTPVNTLLCCYWLLLFMIVIVVGNALIKTKLEF